MTRYSCSKSIACALQSHVLFAHPLIFGSSSILIIFSVHNVLGKSLVLLATHLYQEKRDVSLNFWLVGKHSGNGRDALLLRSCIPTPIPLNVNLQDLIMLFEWLPNSHGLIPPKKTHANTQNTREDHPAITPFASNCFWPLKHEILKLDFFSWIDPLVGLKEKRECH